MDDLAGKTLEQVRDETWLACAIESEGSISLTWSGGNKSKRYWNKSKNKWEKKRLQIIPRVNLTNKDEDYIENAHRISYANGVGCHVSSKTKGIKVVTWSGVKRVAKLLPIITPYLFGKKEVALYVQQYCNLRLDKFPNDAAYGEKEKELFFAVREFNGKGRKPASELKFAFEE